VREQGIVREFESQLFELSTRQPDLPLAQSCQGEQNLRKRLQIVTLGRRHFKLCHTKLSIGPGCRPAVERAACNRANCL